ncbi:uncharacterized protein IL334_004533 [Kwoniella shivajii]|uniref:Major facilitator superfamily (MFS) profile domain-containing protein n=1 Tax=Kwoniella shivajii TaxID=564305 RepID=A0ABZ1D0Z8_9TREE|nr:hypothetical protein IL334_004533 [Kwoniella shivajii]
MSVGELDVPGTARIYQEEGETVQNAVTLIPTPSKNPDDPLNWTRKRKYLMLSCVVFYTITATILSSDLYSVFDPLSDSTGLSLDQLNVGTGYLYLFIGVSTLISQPASLAFGKRPTYLVSAFGAALVNIWTAFAKGNSQWIASRLLLGFFISPSFTLVEVSIADVFFLHERSFPIGLYINFLFGGVSLGPILSGYIYEGVGWRAIIWLSTGLTVIMGIVLFFFLEETTFEREHDTLSSITSRNDAEVEQEENDPKTTDKGDKTTTSVQNEHSQSRRLESMDITDATPFTPTPWPGPRFWKFMKPHKHALGIMTRGFLQPLAMYRLPLIWWSGLMYATYQICFNLIAAISSGILAAPPYNFSTSAVGLTFLSPFLSAIPGSVYGGYITDKFVLRQAKKNHGIAEAEHKLKLYIIPAALCPIGLLMMGLGPYYGAHWIVYVLGCAIVNLIGPLATILTVSYVFDCYHPIRPKTEHGVQACAQDMAPYLLSTVLLAMVFTFGFNYVITPWCFGWGLRNFAISSALIITVINATVLVVLKWGKRLRRSGERHYRKIIDW